MPSSWSSGIAGHVVTDPTRPPTAAPRRPGESIARFILFGFLALRLLAGSGTARAADGTTEADPSTALFRDGAMTSLAIELTPADFAALREHPREFVRATVRSGDDRFADVAVRLKGAVGSFRDLTDRPSFTLDFARFVAGRTFHGLTRLQLNNSVEDPGLLHELLGGELFRAAGIPAPRVAHARVRLNDRALGVYVLKEGWSPAFLRRHFESAEGALYDNDQGVDVDQPMHRSAGTGTAGGGPTPADVAAAIREPDAAVRWRRLGETLDRDRFITFLAMETLIGHRDGYGLARNNYRIYADPASNRLVFLPDGMDQLFGREPLPLFPPMAGRAAAAVLGMPEGRAAYGRALTNLLEAVMRPAAVVERIDQLTRALRPALTWREARAFARTAADLEERLRLRDREFHRQLADPGPVRPEFTDGIARPSGWRPFDVSAGGRLDQGASPDGVPSLHLRAGRSTSASWRTRVQLETGRYRFEALARTSGVVPRAGARSGGGGLRLGGAARSGAGCVGDTDWRPLVCEFEVTESARPVELLCELNADAGDFWIDLASLRLVRLLPPTEAGTRDRR